MLGSCSLSAGSEYPRPAKEKKSAREGQGRPLVLQPFLFASRGEGKEAGEGT